MNHYSSQWQPITPIQNKTEPTAPNQKPKIARKPRNGKQKTPDLECSLFGKGKSEVLMLVGGLNGFICDQCVETSRDIIGTERTRIREKTDGAENKTPSTHWCSFCNRSNLETGMMVQATNATICEKCIEECRDILGTHRQNI